MIDQEKRVQEQEKKRKVRRRMRASVDPNNYEYYPERKIADFYDTDTASALLNTIENNANSV